MASEITPLPTQDRFQTTFQRRLAIREAAAGILPADQLTSPEARADQYGRLESMIGNTPLLSLPAENGSMILAKVTSQGPSESHYDYATLNILETLEKNGMIKPGDTLVEATSGSLGISFAYMCNRLGFKLKILVPNALPAERRYEMEQFGAELVSVSAHPDYEKDGDPKKSSFGMTVKRYGEMMEEYTLQTPRDQKQRFVFPEGGKAARSFTVNGERLCFSNHAESMVTPAAFQRIGQEVLNVLPAGVNIDAFVGAIGNGSTLKGITEAINAKERTVSPKMRVIGVENEKCPTFYVAKYGEDQFKATYGRNPTYELQDSWGMSQPGYTPPFVDKDQLDEVRLVSPDVRDEVRLQYNSREPQVNTVGNTSAMCYEVARAYAKEHPGSIVLILFYDKGGRYAHDNDEAVMTNGLLNPVEHPIFEKPMIQPHQWKQEVAKTPVELPRTLGQAYRPKEEVVFENIRAEIRKAA